MTRAQQTISLALFATSVSLPPFQTLPMPDSIEANPVPQQLYVAAFFHVIPLAATVQEDIVPVVRDP